MDSAVFWDVVEKIGKIGAALVTITMVWVAVQRFRGRKPSPPPPPPKGRRIFITVKGTNTTAMNRTLSYDTPITAARVAELCGLPVPHAANHLNYWAKEGSLIKTGTGSTATYVIHPEVVDTRPRAA